MKTNFWSFREWTFYTGFTVMLFCTISGYAETVAQHTLKKFIILVYFLDKAKQSRLIEHNPCLFCKDSDIKVRIYSAPK